MDPVLGRKVLDHVTQHREQFDMRDWGGKDECGTVACLAGWTLLLSGYTVDQFGDFTSPGGVSVTTEDDDDAFDGDTVGDEAAGLLRLTDTELYGPPGSQSSLWATFPDDAAVERFRALVEAAELETAGA